MLFEIEYIILSYLPMEDNIRDYIKQHKQEKKFIQRFKKNIKHGIRLENKPCCSYYCNQCNHVNIHDPKTTVILPMCDICGMALYKNRYYLGKCIYSIFLFQYACLFS